MKLTLFLCTVLITKAHSLTVNCDSKLTCQECIQTPLCGWCLDQSISYNRCFNILRLRSGTYFCRPVYVFYPNNRITVSKDEQTSKSTSENSIRPQAIHLALAIGLPREVPVLYSVGQAFKGSSVSLSHTQVDKIRVSYTTQCTGNKTRLSNTCSKVLPGQQLEFKVQFELEECPKNKADWETSVQITSPDLKSSLLVNVTLGCFCNCDKPGSPHYKEKADECNGGTLTCGTCHCNSYSFGKHCECLKYNNELSLNECKSEGSQHGLECSGMGVCVCNRCECDLRSNPTEFVYGKYCECNNFSCPRYGSVLCNGKGRCDCGKCVCEPSWSGEGCELNTP